MVSSWRTLRLEENQRLSGGIVTMGEESMEVEPFVHDEFSGPDFDLDYEFDAARFFDFTRPELEEEAWEAESWFQTSGSYPPSPFVINLNLNSSGDIVEEIAGPASKSKKKLKSDDILNGRSKPMVRLPLSSSSNLLKPTASALAKQNQTREVYSTRLGSFQERLPQISVKSSKKPTLMDSQEAKRQKLETGYVGKVSILKHQSSFAHKVPKKLDNTRLKITIPKEPELETARRAQRNLRCKNYVELADHTKSNASFFKARPLNKKILEAASSPSPKKSMPQQPRFQLFHLMTTERAMQQTSDHMVNLHRCGTLMQNESTNPSRSNFSNILMEERFEAVQSLKALLSNKKDFKLSVDNKFPENLSTELYNKLSLKPDSQPHANSLPKPLLSAKGSKENAPSTLYHELLAENIAKENKPRFGVNCAVDRKILNAGSHLNISRSLDIR